MIFRSGLKLCHRVFTWKQSLISVILGKRGRMMERSMWLAGVHMSISSGGLGPDGEDDLVAWMVRAAF